MCCFEYHTIPIQAKKTMQRELGKAKRSGKQKKGNKKKVVKRKSKQTKKKKGTGNEDDNPITEKEWEHVIPPWTPPKSYNESMYPGGYQQFCNHKRHLLRKKLDELTEAQRGVMGEEYYAHVEREEKRLQAEIKNNNKRNSQKGWVSSDSETETDDEDEDASISESDEDKEDEDNKGMEEDDEGEVTWNVEGFSGYRKKQKHVRVVWEGGEESWQHVEEIKADIGADTFDEYLAKHLEEVKQERCKKQQDKHSNRPCLLCDMKVIDGTRCSTCGQPSHKKCGMNTANNGTHQCYDCMNLENQLIMAKNYSCSNDHDKSGCYVMKIQHWEVLGRKCQGEQCEREWITDGGVKCNDQNPVQICKGYSRCCKMVYCMDCFGKKFQGNQRKRSRRDN